MKKIKYIIGAFLGLSSVGIIAPIAASCSTNSSQNNENEIDYYDKIGEAQKHLITEQSAIDLSDMFIKNVSSRLNNQEINKLTREDIASKVVINENNFIYQKLKEYDLHKKFKEEAISVIYLSYLNEINSNNNLAKCGSIFKRHYWEALGWGLACTSIYLYSTIVGLAIVTKPIFEFIVTHNFKKFENDLKNLKIPKYIYQIVLRTATQTLFFKLRTKCRWSFYIWKDISTNKNLII